jgi:hypothetical protein
MIKSFHDIVKQVHDFLFDHSVDLLVMSEVYIVNQSLMDVHLQKKQNIRKII